MQAYGWCSLKGEQYVTTQTVNTHNTTFEVCWIISMMISIFATLNHIMLPVYGDPIALSIGWTGYSLYAVVVLAIPFRRGERWAWYSIWILVIGFASTVFAADPEIAAEYSVAAAYLIAAGIMALCLLLTRSAFFWKEV
jgi:hypothetical protein